MVAAMFDVDLAFPFSLGLVAAFNPCGFAMLPVYVSFFLGSKEGEQQTSSLRNFTRALTVSAVLTAGFIAVFGAFGLVTSSLLSRGSILKYTPYITVALGVLLVPLAVAMLFGYELKFSTPRIQRGGESKGLVSMFLFGVSYATVSLGCTVGLFISSVANVFTRSSFLDGLAVFIAYALGMGSVIATLTIALALSKNSVAKNMRKMLPWVNRISAVLMLLAGLYLAIFGYWELQVLKDPSYSSAIVDYVNSVQIDVNNFINNIGAVKLGLFMFLAVGAVGVRAAFNSKRSKTRKSASDEGSSAA